MFEIRNLKFKTILNIPFLEIKDKITCLIGQSGSGKTTLLRMLNRINMPDEGEIFYQGQDLSQMDTIQLRRNVVMLGQSPVIYPGNIEENLQIGREFSQKKLSSTKELKKMLEKVELNKNLEDECGNLSGGEKQRLCLARVMLMDADTYLLDEPSSALDTQTEHFVIESLTKFSDEKEKEIILVTHSESISSLFPRSIITMENGRVKEANYE